MSQNRQSEKDRVRAEHDYEINLKAEIEIGQIHKKARRVPATRSGCSSRDAASSDRVPGRLVQEARGGERAT